jgi:hypothetical protein
VNRRWRVAAVFGLAACFLSNPLPTGARQYARPPDFDELWSGVHVLFVGKIDYLRTVPYLPSGSCAEGITPGSITEIEVRVEELLRGAGVHAVQIIRHDPSRDDSALSRGDRVLVYGQRTCADDWHLWAGAVGVAEGDSLKWNDGLRDYVQPWVESHQRKPTLRDVRESVQHRASRHPESAFRQADGFDLVRVEERIVWQDSLIVVGCRALEHLAGRQGEPPTRIRFTPPPGIWVAGFSIGDTLLVPLGRRNDGGERRFATSPEFFVVEDGYLAGLGVWLDRFLDRFEAGPQGYRLIPMVAVRSGQEHSR